MPTQVHRSVWIHEVERRALVLGSSQRADVVDYTAVGDIELVTRRSGGGAVLLVPDEVVWLDVLIPTNDPLWSDDIAAASHWLGETWVRALGGGVVHQGGMVRTRFSSLACFAGLGPGEVTIEGRKLVGVSQRRTRAGARFQCAVYVKLEPEALPAMLSMAPVARCELTEVLASTVAVAQHSVAELTEAFLASLPD